MTRECHYNRLWFSIVATAAFNADAFRLKQVGDQPTHLTYTMVLAAFFWLYGGYHLIMCGYKFFTDKDRIDP